jgi:hypothetical protein
VRHASCATPGAGSPTEGLSEEGWICLFRITDSPATRPLVVVANDGSSAPVDPWSEEPLTSTLAMRLSVAHPDDHVEGP